MKDSKADPVECSVFAAVDTVARLRRLGEARSHSPQQCHNGHRIATHKCGHRRAVPILGGPDAHSLWAKVEAPKKKQKCGRRSPLRHARSGEMWRTPDQRTRRDQGPDAMMLLLEHIVVRYC
jgi:hypothetical protein